MPRTAAFVAATGGAGATRLSVETAAVLAAAGRDVTVFDTAFATQGLASYVRGRIDCDSAALLADPDRPLADAAYPLDLETPGAVELVPAYAPFARLADASTPTAAATLGDRLAEADADYVVVDTPPVLSNPAVASVDAADAVALVAPPGERGIDGVSRERGRLADVDAAADVLVANRTPDTPLDADVAVPVAADSDVPETPGVLDAPQSAFALAVGRLAASVFDCDLDLPEEPGLVDRARAALENK